MGRVLLAGLVIAGGSAGCATMNNTERGAATGAALGGGAGLVTGALLGAPKTGLAAGALLGGGAGALAGNHQDRKDEREREVIQAQATATAEAQAQQRRMGIADVIDMTQKGHDEQVIIEQIKSTGSTFQLAGSDLDMLKANGVSPRVIGEMQRARPAPVTRVIRDPQPTTVIYEQPVYGPPPVYVVPRHRHYCPPPGPVFVGGYYRFR